MRKATDQSIKSSERDGISILFTFRIDTFWLPFQYKMDSILYIFVLYLKILRPVT